MRARTSAISRSTCPLSLQLTVGVIFIGLRKVTASTSSSQLECSEYGTPQTVTFPLLDFCTGQSGGSGGAGAQGSLGVIDFADKTGLWDHPEGLTPTTRLYFPLRAGRDMFASSRHSASRPATTWPIGLTQRFVSVLSVVNICDE